MSTHVRSFDAVMDIYHIKMTLTKCVKATSGKSILIHLYITPSLDII